MVESSMSYTFTLIAVLIFLHHIGRQWKCAISNHESPVGYVEHGSPSLDQLTFCPPAVVARSLGAWIIPRILGPPVTGNLQADLLSCFPSHYLQYVFDSLGSVFPRFLFLEAAAALSFKKPTRSHKVNRSGATVVLSARLFPYSLLSTGKL
jgi:hypothetical protein